MITDPNKPYQTVESNNVTKATFVCDLRDYGKGPELVLIFARGNSRQFDYGVKRFLQLLRPYGITILVSIAGVEIPLEQFETSGVWGVRKSATVQAPQGRYNMTTEINRLRGELVNLKENDPRQTYVVERINTLEAQLNTAAPKNTQEIEDTKRSEEALMNLVDKMQQEAFDKFLLVPDEELATLDFSDLVRFGITKGTRQWTAVVSRWNQARLKFPQTTTTPNTGDNNNA